MKLKLAGFLAFLSVNITLGGTVPFSISSYFNKDGASSDAALGQGNLDSNGHSFPAETPYVPGNLPASDLDFTSEQGTVFHLGPTTGSSSNCIQSVGQTLYGAFGQHTYVDILFAPMYDTDGSIVFHHENGVAETGTVYSTTWTYVPDGPGVGTAWRCNHRHAAHSNENVWVFLSQQRFAVTPDSPIVAIDMPNVNSIYVLGISGDGRADSPWWDDFGPRRKAWSVFDAAISDQGVITEQSASHDYGKVETAQAITVDVSTYRKLVVQVSSVNTGAHFTVQIEEDGGAHAVSNVFENVSEAGTYQADIASLMGWQGKKSFRIAVWIVGEGKTIDLDLVSVEDPGDGDGDGMPDAWEYQHFGLLTNSADGDVDADGLNNVGEWRLNTDPRNADTDGDSIPDGWEARHGTDPHSRPTRAIDLVEVGSTNSYQSWWVAAVSNYAYVRQYWPDVLKVYDISDPARPAQVGSYTTSSGRKLRAVGTTVYWATYYGVEIIDASTPTNPVKVGTCSATDARDAFVVSNRVYVPCGYDGLRIFDISTPSSPVQLGFIDTPGVAESVWVESNTAYVADGYGSGLQVIDVSDPAHPAIRGRYNAPGSAVDVKKDAGTVYALYGTSLQVVNLDNVNVPVALGSYPFFIGRQLDVRDDLAFVADDWHGLDVLDVGVPADPRLVSHGCTNGAYSFSVTSNLLCVVDYSSLRIFRIDEADTDGDGMRDDWEIASFGTLTNGPGGDVDGDGLSNWGEFITGLDAADADQDADGLNDGDEIRIYNSDPRLVDTDNDGIADGEEVVPGADGYVTNPSLADTDGDGMPDGWEVLYGLNPTSAADAAGDLDGDLLSNVEEFRRGTVPTNADTDGDTLPDGWEVQRGIDPTNTAFAPIRLDLLATLYVDGSANDVSVRSNIAAIAVQDFGLKIADVSTPTNPIIVGSYAIQNHVMNYSLISLDVQMEGARAFISSSESWVGPGRPSAWLSAAVRAFDVSVPSSPSLCGYQALGGPPAGFFATSNRLYAGQSKYTDYYSLVGSNALRIVDASSSPFAEMSCLVVGSSPVGVQAVSNLAYVAGEAGTLGMLGVSNAAAPVVLGAYSTNASPQAVAVKSNVAYLVCASPASLHAVAVGNPLAPAGLGSCALPSWPSDIDLADDFAFVAGGTGGVIIVDVLNPAAPFQQAVYDTPVYASGIDVEGNRVYVADGANGVVIYGIFVDRDEDGMRDAWEMQMFGSLTNGAAGDVDGDGLSNLGEHNAGLNPTNPDTDGDGVNDHDEVWVYHTDPFLSDSDGDGMSDYGEVRAGTDPNDAASVFLADGQNLGPAADRMVVAWSSVLGRAYGVWRATNLPGAFMPLATNIPAVLPQNVYTDAVTGVGPFFYRVRVE